MEFSKEYFWDEVRDGFYVSGIMKRSLAAQMEVLGEIDKVCKRHNIRWFADCGTLLGAVRHGGVIPWDDEGHAARAARPPEEQPDFYSRFSEMNQQVSQPDREDRHE